MATPNLKHNGEVILHITTVGVDLAKEVITVCTMDHGGHVLHRQNLRATEFAQWLVQLPSGTTLGMEACSSAHHWARKMQAMGLLPKLMAADVQPFRKSRSAKNDRNDAEAIANKHARYVWAMLAKGEEYNQEAWKRLSKELIMQ